MNMNTDLDAMTDDDVSNIIQRWTDWLPAKPTAVQPLFVWTNSLGPVYLARLWAYNRRMRQTGWDKYIEAATAWCHKVNKAFYLIDSEQAWPRHRVSERLNRFIQDECSRQSDRTISQAGWDRLSRCERRALRENDGQG